MAPKKRLGTRKSRKAADGLQSAAYLSSLLNYTGPKEVPQEADEDSDEEVYTGSRLPSIDPRGSVSNKDLAAASVSGLGQSVEIPSKPDSIGFTNMEYFYKKLLSGKDARLANVLGREKSTTDSLRGKVAEMQERIDELETECEKIETERHNYDETIKVLQHQVEQQQSEIKEMRDQMSSYEVKNLQKELRTVKNKCEFQENKLRQAQNQTSALQLLAAPTRQKASEAKTGFEGLREGVKASLDGMGDLMKAEHAALSERIKHHERRATIAADTVDIFTRNWKGIQGAVDRVYKGVNKAADLYKAFVKAPEKRDPDDNAHWKERVDWMVERLKWTDKAMGKLLPLLESGVSVSGSGTLAGSPSNGLAKRLAAKQNSAMIRDLPSLPRPPSSSDQTESQGPDPGSRGVAASSVSGGTDVLSPDLLDITLTSSVSGHDLQGSVAGDSPTELESNVGARSAKKGGKRGKKGGLKAKAAFTKAIAAMKDSPSELLSPEQAETPKRRGSKQKGNRPVSSDSSMGLPAKA